MPTAESLANLHKAVTEALKLAPGMTFTQETKSPTLKDCIAINCGVGFDKRPPIDRAPIAADLPVDGDGFIDG